MPSPNESFLNELYSVEKTYSVEGYFYEPLFVFEDNVDSLARFYAYLLKNNELFIVRANNAISALGGGDAYETAFFD